MTINTSFFADLDPKDSFSQNEEVTGEVCIPNISPLERRKRQIFAIQEFIVTLVILGVLILLGVNPLWRLFLFFMFSAATVSYIQALDKTWVSLATRGSRKFSVHEERIEDEAELRQVRRQARRVVLKGVLVAIPLTLIAYFLPWW